MLYILYSFHNLALVVCVVKRVIVSKYILERTVVSSVDLAAIMTISSVSEGL